LGKDRRLPTGGGRMRFGRRACMGLALAGVLSLVITTTSSGVAPSWPQFRFDNAHSGTTSDNAITTANVANLTQAWTGATGGFVFSSPAVAGGVVYVGSFDHKLYAFDAAGGNATCTGVAQARTCSPLWTADAGGFVISSSPAVAGGVVYVGSENGKLY